MRLSELALPDMVVARRETALARGLRRRRTRERRRVSDAHPHGRPSHVRTVPVGTPLRAIARILLREGIGCVPIVDAGGRPVAIVTRRDVVCAGIRGL